MFLERINNNFNKLTTIPFTVSFETSNKKNIDLYMEYLKSNIFKHTETLNTTYKAYYSNMKLFFYFLYKYEDNPYILNEEFLLRFTDVWERYSYYCYECGNNKRTIANKRTACSTFFDWCVKKRYILINPFTFIDKIKVTDNDKVRESYFLTSKEIWKIKYFLNEGLYIYKKGNTQKKLRFDLQDNLLFNIFLDTGGRISEIHNLRLDQIDLENMVFEDVRLKEGYVEPLIFFDETQKLLKKWLEYRKENNIESDYLFITNYAKQINHMSKTTIRAIIKKIGKIVDIEDFYPHSIRKTIINITAETDEELASKFAHHSSLSVTRRHYVKKTNVNTIRNKMQNARNRAGL